MTRDQQRLADYLAHIAEAIERSRLRRKRPNLKPSPMTVCLSGRM